MRFALQRVLVAAVVLASLVMCAPAQQTAKRLIMKDGTYQSATQWDVVGNRVRYYSAERFIWEEIPKEMVDWAATARYNKDTDAQSNDALKETARQDEADERESPLVASGLRLPGTGGVYLMEQYQGQPQLLELVQNGGELNKHMGKNILRAAINPLALSSTQTIELKGERARVQSHVAQPAIFINVESGDTPAVDLTQKLPNKEQPPSRYGIVRVENKKGVRVIGKLNVAMYGKVSQKEQWSDATSTTVGDWVKLVPTRPLPPGEYAVVELLEKKQINLFVWDFGVDLNAPANAGAWTARPADATGKSATPTLQKRPK